MQLDQALKIVREAGYRVTKPKPKKENRRGPTCVVKYTDDVVCRMSTFCSDDKLDWERGLALCQAAYESRTRHAPNFARIESAWFERDGKVLAIY